MKRYLVPLSECLAIALPLASVPVQMREHTDNLIYNPNSTIESFLQVSSEVIIINVDLKVLRLCFMINYIHTEPNTYTCTLIIRHYKPLWSVDPFGLICPQRNTDLYKGPFCLHLDS